MNHGETLPWKSTGHVIQVLFPADGDWVKVDDIHVGLKGKQEFFDSRDFLIDPAAPSYLVVQLSIAIQGVCLCSMARLIHVVGCILLCLTLSLLREAR